MSEKWKGRPISEAPEKELRDAAPFLPVAQSMAVEAELYRRELAAAKGRAALDRFIAERK